MEPDELNAWLRLQLSPGVGNGTARKLLAAFGRRRTYLPNPPPPLMPV